MAAILIGVVFVLVGLWGVAHWVHDLVAVLKGLGPISMVLGGVIAIVAGISSLRPPRTGPK